GRNEGGEEWFRGALRGEVYYSPDVIRSPQTGALSVVFSAPLRDRASGKLMGVVASWVNWGVLFDEGLAKKERFGTTGELLLVDAKQHRLLASGRGSGAGVPDELVRRIETSSAERGTFVYADRESGHRYLAGWAVEA